MLTRAGFELALLGYRSAALPVELSSLQRLEARQLNAYPCKGVQCFNSISESSSEIYMNRKCFHDNLTLPKSTEKSLLERALNSHLRDTGPPLQPVLQSSPLRLEASFYSTRVHEIFSRQLSAYP